MAGRAGHDFLAAGDEHHQRKHTNRNQAALSPGTPLTAGMYGPDEWPRSLAGAA
jgi:hypothetical protein